MDEHTGEFYFDLLDTLYYQLSKPQSRYRHLGKEQLSQLILRVCSPDFVTTLIAMRPEYKDEFEQAIARYKRETNKDGATHLVRTERSNITAIAEWRARKQKT